MRGRERLDNSIYVERYLAVTKFMEEHKNTTLGYACSVLSIPINGYYRGKELVAKGVVPIKANKDIVYTELTEPVFYLGSWFIPQVTYPITPRLRS
jgi:hypothetical protein